MENIYNILSTLNNYKFTILIIAILLVIWFFRNEIKQKIINLKRKTIYIYKKIIK